jgi:hypothetical protein
MQLIFPNNRRSRTFFEGCFDVVVAVEPFAFDREEKLPRPNRSRIDRIGLRNLLAREVASGGNKIGDFRQC